MSLEIQEDCVGILLKIKLVDSAGVPISLVNHTEVKYLIESPTGVKVEMAGSVSGDAALGVIIYVTASSVFNSPGNWKYQGRVTYNTGVIFYTKVIKLKIKVNL